MYSNNNNNNKILNLSSFFAMRVIEFTKAFWSDIDIEYTGRRVGYGCKFVCGGGTECSLTCTGI